MIGIDTSYLICWSIREHEKHQEARLFYENHFVKEKNRALLSSQVIQEWLHVVTDPKRFEKPLLMSDAIMSADRFLNASEFKIVHSSVEVDSLFMRWMREHSLSRKRILDTYLAATYYHAGARKILSTNWRDFKIFGVFEQILF